MLKSGCSISRSVIWHQFINVSGESHLPADYYEILHTYLPDYTAPKPRTHHLSQQDCRHYEGDIISILWWIRPQP